MNLIKAETCIEYEIAKISRTHSPSNDRTFVMGMIELAECCELISVQTANRYKDALDSRFIKRRDFLKVGAT